MVVCASLCASSLALCVCVWGFSLSLSNHSSLCVLKISLFLALCGAEMITLSPASTSSSPLGGPPPVSSLLCVPLCACAPAHLLVGRRHFTRTKKRVHTQQCVDSAVTITPPLHTAVTVETKRIPTPTHRLAGGYSFVDDEAKRDGCTKTTSTARSPLWPARCAPCVGIPPTA